MNKLEFKSEDFTALCNTDCISDETHAVNCLATEAANITNARLAEMLAECPVVYRNTPTDDCWGPTASATDTRRAYLVNVEPLSLSESEDIDEK